MDKEMTNSSENAKKELKKEMGRIRDLWTHYFMPYQYLRDSVKNPKNTDRKYVGTIIGNYIDTFDIIYRDRSSSSFAAEYSGNMSLMQAIYIQQDLMEELLLIFRCGIVKEELRKDENYLINRTIRNELMGHPIRKHQGELISTTLLSYNGEKGCINYRRSHHENGFSSESVSHPINDIIQRHTEFIKTYFSKILLRMQEMIQPFINNLNQCQDAIETFEFSKLVEFILTRFESIKDEYFIYNKESLLKVYSKKDNHIRYKNLIDYFIVDLKESLEGHLENISHIFNPPQKSKSANTLKIPEVKIEMGNGRITIVHSDDRVLESKDEVDFGYELGKLATDRKMFTAWSAMILEKCPDNILVREELEHMSNNLNNDIEYYCSHRLLEIELHEND